MSIRPSFAALALVGLLTLGCERPALRSDCSTTDPAHSAPEQREQPQILRRVHLVAVGDVMLDRGVGSTLRSRGCESILSGVRDRLNAADITFCNLESPLSTRGPRAPSDCVFRAEPRAVGVLKDGGFDIVSVANNHMLNSGRRALLDTLDILDRNGILYCGARRAPKTAWWPTYLEAGGLKIGFMAYTDLSFGHGSDNKVAPDLSNLVQAVKAADNKCDLLVVSFHWGEEYFRDPTQRQRRVARVAVDAGADLILGHHPHVLEGLAAYKGVPILYSMGNFVFDQKAGEHMESALFDLEYVELWGWDITATPVVITRPGFSPQFAPSERAAKISQRLFEISAKLGTFPTLGQDNTIRLHVSGRPKPAGDIQQRSDTL